MEFLRKRIYFVTFGDTIIVNCTLSIINSLFSKQWFDIPLFFVIQ